MDDHIIWQERPSQVLNLLPFLSCLLVITFPWACWKYWQTKALCYTLTAERLKISRGVFSQQKDEVELYRVKDYQIDKPFLLRAFGVANLTLYTNDLTCPTVRLRGIENVENIKDIIRKHVEQERQTKGVLEID